MLVVCTKLLDNALAGSIMIVSCFHNFQVSPEGVAIRDEKVFRFAKDQNIPLLMLTSGGNFAHNFLSSSVLEDLLMMHLSCL